VIAQLASTVKFVWDSGTKLSVDGNSYSVGTGSEASRSITAWLALQDNMTAVNYANVGIGGQTLAAMTSAATDIDGAFDGTKRNVLLLLGEPRNYIFNNVGNESAAYTAMKAYIAARKAAHAWSKIVLCTTFPSYQITASVINATANDRMLAYDALIKAPSALADLGVDKVVDLRIPGTPFGDFTDWNLPTFRDDIRVQCYTSTDGSGNYIHPNQKGYETHIYPAILTALRNLPA
jgi:hypothetical protein